MKIPMFIGALAIGLAAGLFGGLVGLGGGVIMVPLMVGALGLAQHRAHGTSLVAVVFTGFAGAIAYAMQGSIDVWAGVLLALSAIVTARFGAIYANGLPEWKLKRAFGAFIIVISVLLLLKPYVPPLGLAQELWGRVAVLLLTGGVTGFLSAMMGVGGGTVMVPSMVLLLGMTQHLAQGSALLAMVPASFVGAYTHYRLGNVERSILPGLILGVFIGSYSGGSLAHLFPDAELRAIFAVVLIATGVRYLRSGNGGKPRS